MSVNTTSHHGVKKQDLEEVMWSDVAERSSVGLKFWCCQNVSSNPGLAGRGACVLEQDT